MMETSDSDASTSKRPFKCTEKNCNASFSKNSKLTYHLRKHTGERPFVCDEIGCDKTYTNSSHLRRHKKLSHEGKKSHPVKCELEGCGLILANKYSLKKHYNRKHNSINYPFICAECSQGFHRKKQLQQHVYLHTGEPPFICDQCDMSFTTNRNLNRHKKYHRTYTCDCGEIFDRWSSILSHKKLCKKPRFKCDICEKTFSHLSNYKNHKLVHMKKSEKMVFVCPYPDCKRFYFYKKNIKYHIDNFHKRINENKTYNCTYPKCTVKLKTKQCLKMHLQRHFEWVQKKQRHVRFDKGKPRKSMISILTGQEQPTESNDENLVEKQLQPNEICITNEVGDEVLLKQCDIALSLLNEKMVTAIT